MYRTATTTYPCYLPVLGDSMGAGRTRLTRGKDTNFLLKKNFSLIFFLYVFILILLPKKKFMDREEKILITRQLMTYGAIISVLVIANSYILYLNGVNEYTNTQPSFFQNLRVFILGMGIFFAIKHLTEKILIRKISFGQYLLFGSLIGVFYGIIDSFYFVIFAKYIEPGTLQSLINISKEQYKMLQLPTNQLDMMVQMINKPIVLFFTNIFSDILITFFYTLFFAILYVIMNNIKKRL